MFGTPRSGKLQVEKGPGDVVLEKLNYKIHQACMFSKVPV